MAVGKSPPKKKAEIKKEGPKEEKMPAAGKRGIVRIAGKDIKGHLTLKRGLLQIKGIGHTVVVAASNIIVEQLGLPNNAIRVGDLSDEQIEKIDGILYNLDRHAIPVQIRNRRKDYISGEDKHLIMNDLIFATTQDVEREKKEYSWRGYRHAYGQKVRGQRTRNTGRKGMAVGVLRKTILAAQGAAKAGAEKAGAQAAQPKAAAPGKAVGAPSGTPAPAEKKK